MGFILAIDGPAGAGKSTVSRLVAERLGFALVDTGAIYRSVALRALDCDIAWTDDARLGVLAGEIRIEFKLVGHRNCVLLDGVDVTDAIRQPQISKGASLVASRPSVRASLLDLQRRLGRAQPRGAVLEGRDIGTVVFPDADVKVFLTASPEIRARRRYEELIARGADTTVDVVLADQVARDRDDASRAIAPLRPAEDAVIVDTTGLDTENVVARIADLVPRAHE